MTVATDLQLTLQHPVLPRETVDRFIERIGSEPSQQSNVQARWILSSGHALADRDRLRALALEWQVDIALRPVGERLADFRVLACDMDSTLIDIECIDEIAVHAGQGEAVAAITAAAMRGERMDFDASLRQRVALLRGVPLDALETILRERLNLSPGASTLIATARRLQLSTLLVSGGFTWFAERVAAQLGIEHIQANELGIDSGGRLTGEVVGRIVNPQAKADALLALCAQQGCAPSQAIAIGDGANDLEMMAVAGLSVAYRAKPRVQADADLVFNHVGLDGLLGVLNATAGAPAVSA